MKRFTFVLILCFFLFSNCPLSRKGSCTTDLNNLKGLVDSYITGLTESKSSPKSTGHRFWLALFVGDPESIEDGLKIENAFCAPGAAKMLVHKLDYGAYAVEVIEIEIQKLVDAGISGWDKLPGDDNRYTSYAGPADKKFFEKGGIVGCDGSRNGQGYNEDGFEIVRGNKSCEFKKYKRLAKFFPNEWTGNETEPNWDSKYLKTVINLE